MVLDNAVKEQRAQGFRKKDKDSLLNGRRKSKTQRAKFADGY